METRVCSRWRLPFSPQWTWWKWLIMSRSVLKKMGPILLAGMPFAFVLWRFAEGHVETWVAIVVSVCFAGIVLFRVLHEPRSGNWSRITKLRWLQIGAIMLGGSLCFTLSLGGGVWRFMGTVLYIASILISIALLRQCAFPKGPKV